MTWTNAFDVGECTVEVHVPAASRTDMSEVMAKGDTQSFTDPGYGAMSVVVSSDGVVTLNNVDGLGIETNFELRVIPSYSLSGYDGIRATLPFCVSSAGIATSNGNDSVDFTNGDAYADLGGYDAPDRIACTTQDMSSNSDSPMLQFTPEVDVAAPVEPVNCTELGRVTRCYVSGYQRARVHESRLVRGESRCLVANFNGAIDPARTITSVTWRTNQYQAVYMANARVAQGAREVAVDITAQTGSRAWVKCEATMDNGEVYTQLFNIDVLGSPWFAGETAPAIGPAVLTASV